MKNCYSYQVINHNYESIDLVSLFIWTGLTLALVYPLSYLAYILLKIGGLL